VINVISPSVSATISGLIPFADYRVSVKCIERLEYNTGDFTPRGYWSNAADISFTTEPDGEPIVMKCKIVATNVTERLHVWYLVHEADCH